MVDRLRPRTHLEERGRGLKVCKKATKRNTGNTCQDHVLFGEHRNVNAPAPSRQEGHAVVHLSGLARRPRRHDGDSVCLKRENSEDFKNITFRHGSHCDA